jgi:hypothetical protein
VPFSLTQTKRALIASRLGSHHTDEAKKKISDAKNHQIKANRIQMKQNLKYLQLKRTIE